MLPRGMRTFHDSGQAEGLGFNLYVVPTDSLGPSISQDLLVGSLGSQREKMVMILVDIRTEV